MNFVAYTTLWIINNNGGTISLSSFELCCLLIRNDFCNSWPCNMKLNIMKRQRSLNQNDSLDSK